MGIRPSCLHLVCANTWLSLCTSLSSLPLPSLLLYLSLSLLLYQGFSHIQLTKLRSLVLQLSWVISRKLTALVGPELPDTFFRPHPVFLVQNLIDSLYQQKQKMASNPCTSPMPRPWKAYLSDPQLSSKTFSVQVLGLAQTFVSPFSHWVCVLTMLDSSL